MLSQESLVWLRIFGYWYRRLSAFSLFQPEHNGTLKLANSRNATDLSTKQFPSTHEKRKGKKNPGVFTCFALTMTGFLADDLLAFFFTICGVPGAFSVWALDITLTG